MVSVARSPAVTGSTWCTLRSSALYSSSMPAAQQQGEDGHIDVDAKINLWLGAPGMSRVEGTRQTADHSAASTTCLLSKNKDVDTYLKRTRVGNTPHHTPTVPAVAHAVQRACAVKRS
jgi:hypothetical protein